ncbi:putative Proteasome subunit beta type-4 [Blattamonas nauphoetae]|uniref:Proteasome subunit beta n=1 Tax=Blattamonas nauphoetae TaxID=2049346 RepID=A0ABQ9YHL0_9EUKA|nr:putative Proteasome subunit beta type-4 [Blattamonas nauphoetae]
MEVYSSCGTVLGIKYQNGVLLASEKIINSGKTARYFGIERTKQISPTCLITASGEYSDFQEVTTLLKERQEGDFCHNDNHSISPKSYHSYATRIMYQRRNKQKPYTLRLVVAGIDSAKPFLGTVDLYGTPIVDHVVATGIGEHIAKPILIKAYAENQNMTRDQAEKVLIDAMTVLFLRDCRGYPHLEISGIEIDANGKVQALESKDVEINTKNRWASPNSVDLPI